MTATPAIVSFLTWYLSHAVQAKSWMLSWTWRSIWRPPSFFVSVASDQRWRAGFADPALSAVAEKAMKETAYHIRHAAEWLIRLGDGTAESHRRAQTAVDALWEYTGEITGDRAAWLRAVTPVLTRATLRQPEDDGMHDGGRAGRHTSHLAPLLAEMQILPRTFPGAVW